MVFVLAALCLVLATGCPFTSEVPIAQPGNRAPDERLVGAWFGAFSNGDSVAMEVFSFNDAEYYVELYDLDEDSNEIMRCRVFEFDVDGSPFLHVNGLESGGEPSEYFFVRYSFPSDSELSLRLVGEDIVPPELSNDPRGLLAFLRDHVKDPALDDEGSALVLIRRE
jgi:hypothetical protein